MPTIESLASDIGGLRKSLDDAMPALSQKLDAQKAEIEATRTTADGTAAELAKAHGHWDSVKAEALGVVNELKAKVENLEKAVARGDVPLGTKLAVSTKSIGQALFRSDEVKEMKAMGNYRSRPIELKKSDLWIPGSHKWGAPPSLLTKDTSALTSTELGALLQEWRWDQIIQFPLRPVRLDDFIPSVQVTSNSVEYPQESVTHELYAELEAAVVATDTTAILKCTAEGFFPGQVITFDAGAGGEESVTIDPAGVDYATRTITFSPALANGHAIDSSVTSEFFSFTPEANIKPASRVEFIPRTENIKTLATIMPMSKQMLDDFTALENLMDLRMRQFLALAKERQQLYGANTQREIQGILTAAGIQSYARSTVAGQTKLDALRRALTLVFLAFFPGDVIVLHPSDMEDIELEKGTDDHYVFSQIQTQPAVNTVWRAALVETSVINPLQSLVGSFQMGVVEWNRMEVEMSISDQNRDWWERNLLGIRLEERMAQTVIRPASFVDVDLNP